MSVSDFQKELAGKVDEFGQAFAAFKKTQESDIEKYGKIAEGTKQELDAFIQKMGSAVEAQEKTSKELSDYKARLEDMETAMSRPGYNVMAGGKDAALSPEEKAYNDAFQKMLRNPKSADSIMGAVQMPEELKAMSVGSEADGGYMVPRNMSSRIATRLFETSPIRELAYAETIIDGDSLDIEIDDNEAGAGWVGETETRSETDTPQVGMLNIPVHESYAWPKATQKLLRSVQNIPQYLERKVVDKLTRLENTAFVSGNGEKKPRGILTYAAWASEGTYERNKIEQVVGGTDGSVTRDSFIKVQKSLLEIYQSNAHWLMKRATWGNALLMDDGIGRNYIGWGLDKNNMLRPQILGQPVRFADDMPAEASDALAVAYGDFYAGYTIVDQEGIRLLVDPYTDSPRTIYKFHKPVGGGVSNYEAIKLMKLSAS